VAADRLRLVRAALVLAALLLAIVLLLAAPAAAARQVLITPAQSGKTFHLRKGGKATLRLPGRWSWTQPRVSSGAVELTPVAFFRDPGYSEWVVRARARGRATIKATGAPACVRCGLGVAKLRVTIAVP
jgi:uncharacterized protein (DUF58 family)